MRAQQELPALGTLLLDVGDKIDEVVVHLVVVRGDPVGPTGARKLNQKRGHVVGDARILQPTLEQRAPDHHVEDEVGGDRAHPAGPHHRGERLRVIQQRVEALLDQLPLPALPAAARPLLQNVQQEVDLGGSERGAQVGKDHRPPPKRVSYRTTRPPSCHRSVPCNGGGVPCAPCSLWLGVWESPLAEIFRFRAGRRDSCLLVDEHEEHEPDDEERDDRGHRRPVAAGGGDDDAEGEGAGDG